MEFAKNIEFNNSPVVGQETTITYHGFLSDSNELTLVCGFGESWEHTTETLMEKNSSGFSAKINMLDFDTFHFCFKNSNNEWDNNNHCNYTSTISPCPATPKFDIDALIEEILDPIIEKSASEKEENITVQISQEPIDLGLEISNILSQISVEDTSENLVEYSTLDEILACTVIEETPVELFENETINEIEQTPETSKETALINTEDVFLISPRKLNKFYLFRKHIKLSLYKLLVKLPNLIFGSEEQ